jgi:alpha-beta hydrolase superfamily lysophospholipase
MILLHGRDDFIGYRLRYPFIARRCNRAGFNVVTLVAPYHFQRRPRGFRLLSRPDYLLFAKATAQAVAEIRALTGWLLEAGCPAVALWGSSMGGWLAGLTVCRDARLAGAVLTKPAVRSNPLIAELVMRPGVREALRRLRASDELLDRTPVNLTSAQPAIPKQRVLLIEAIHDLLTPPEPIEDLWRAWGRPDIWRLPQGHISLSLMPGLTGRVLLWLASRLEFER